MGPTTPTWNNNNTVLNESYYTENLSCITMFKTLDFLAIIIAVIGVAGNAIVLWLLAFHIRRNAFSTYVLNLAGADFLYLCIQTVHSWSCFLWLHRRFYEFLINVLRFSYLAGLSMIAAISAERCLSVLWPIWYHCQRPRHTSAIMCALLWSLCLLLSLLFGEGCGEFSHYEHSFCITLTFITAAFLILLFVVLCVSSLVLLVKIVCRLHRIPVTRFFVTLTLTVNVFIFFGLPIGICSLLLGSIMQLSHIFTHNVLEILTFLSFINSCANPIIYFLVGSIRHHKLQWQTLKQLLQKAMQDTPEEEGEERGPSQKSVELETVQ
ncbi:mas-related G-protein coupled receptor member B4-like [Apodemus sylvaticus]|uniref:mas-related G-protein coupled receptor member B4-like n=1 Tax=Apodemus sylvaticus TaxID=10129 RepID=UPI0022420D04|nr:mas-related G-protein coupled receptor member B4-like [Apodemus sylvaticus]